MSVRFNPAGWSDRLRANHSATIPTDSCTDHLAKGSRADFPSLCFMMGFFLSLAPSNHPGFQFPPDPNPSSASSTFAFPSVYFKTSSKLCDCGKDSKVKGVFPFFFFWMGCNASIQTISSISNLCSLANLKELPMYDSRKKATHGRRTIYGAT